MLKNYQLSGVSKMAVQGGYTINHRAALAGMVADGQLCNTVSKLNKSTTVYIPWGSGVVSDGEYGAKLPVPASTAAQFNGVVKYELNRAHADGTSGAIPQYDMTVVTEGVIWVKVLDTVAKDTPVHLRVGATGAGEFSGIVGTGVTLGVLIPNAKFLTGGNAGDLVKISLGLGG
jgi:hypothetical protein